MCVAAVPWRDCNARIAAIAEIAAIARHRRDRKSQGTGRSIVSDYRYNHLTPMANRSLRAIASLVLLLTLNLSAEPPKKAASKKSVAEQIKLLLSQPQFARAHWGIDVVDVDSGKV